MNNQLRTIEEYVESCNYSGDIDRKRVAKALRAYCSALDTKKIIVELTGRWWNHLKLVELIVEVAGQIDNAARAARDALDARDARAARDALDALDARDARAALDALDALDALTSLQRFAAWCVQNSGYYWYGWELSWIVTTAFGWLCHGGARDGRRRIPALFSGALAREGARAS